MSIVEIAIVAVIAFAVFFALRHIIIKRKGGCSCGCSECDRACGNSDRK